MEHYKKMNQRTESCVWAFTSGKARKLCSNCKDQNRSTTGMKQHLRSRRRSRGFFSFKTTDIIVRLFWDPSEFSFMRFDLSYPFLCLFLLFSLIFCSLLFAALGGDRARPKCPTQRYLSFLASVSRVCFLFSIPSSLTSHFLFFSIAFLF